MTDAEAVVVALVTAPPEAARPLARALVDSRAVACANVVPAVWSTYRWEGQVEEADESLLVLKTTRGRLADLEVVLDDAHPYDIYELVVLDVAGGSAAYLAWVAGSVAPTP
ncbi:MAG: divalent-cation tolerance protein CutA [Acidimicrobiales bacterium]